MHIEEQFQRFLLQFVQILDEQLFMIYLIAFVAGFIIGR